MSDGNHWAVIAMAWTVTFMLLGLSLLVRGSAPIYIGPVDFTTTIKTVLGIATVGHFVLALVLMKPAVDDVIAYIRAESNGGDSA